MTVAKESMTLLNGYLKLYIIFILYKPFYILAIKRIGPRPEYPQTTVDKVASAFELDFVYLFIYLIDCLSVGKYSNISPHPPLFSSATEL